jgi:hypothetical protein
MRRHYQRRTVAVQAQQQLFDSTGRHRCQIGGRLVGKQQGWFTSPGTGQGKTLLFAAGERARRPVAQTRQITC